MNELIPINYDNENPAVSGRELHKFLEVKTAYKDWFPRMTEYGFADGTDFCSILSESTGGRPSTDHALSLDMAKELCMLQRAEKGKQARLYFIAIEKEWNSPEMVMARGWKIAQGLLAQAQDKVKLLEVKIEEDAPKVLFADAVSVSNDAILVGEMAKVLKQNGIDIGEKRFFEWLRSNGFLIKRQGTDYNTPTQKAMELGLLKVKKTAITHSDGRVSTGKTSKVTGKGQVYFVNKFKEKFRMA